jgi:PIN domain nuclease of toxin-antitoxin system
MKALGFIDLPITQDHALAVSLLPATHADPFDRILIAQAQVEGLTFVTRDARALTYSVKTIRAKGVDMAIARPIFAYPPVGRPRPG